MRRSNGTSGGTGPDGTCGVALGVVAWLAGEAEKDTGFRYAVDGSALE
jgi:hypothetical protein